MSDGHKHGTAWGYVRGCRCDGCRAAASVYRRSEKMRTYQREYRRKYRRLQSMALARHRAQRNDWLFANPRGVRWNATSGWHLVIALGRTVCGLFVGPRRLAVSEVESWWDVSPDSCGRCSDYSRLVLRRYEK